MRSLFAAFVFLAGCTDGVNVQYLPIGSRCGSAEQCGTPPFGCALHYPGGYCQRDCLNEGDCPLDSSCVAGSCRRHCGSDRECRNGEGYVCRSTSAPQPVCELPAASSADGGSGD